MPRARTFTYGQPLIKDLDRRARQAQTDMDDDLLNLLNRAARFLRTRLTDAAKHGCHHCDEPREHRGAPCRWCGLK